MLGDVVMNPKEIKNLKDIVMLFDREEEVLKFRLHLDNETDRGCALMAAAFLDELLIELLQNFLVDDQKSFKELFSGTGGLSTFASRIELSYLLGLIPVNAKRDLHLIRKIRNKFAHSMDVIDFNHPSIASRCRELKYNVFQDQLPPRKAFNRVAFGIAGIINGAAMKTEKRQEEQDINLDSEELKVKVEQTRKAVKLYNELMKEEKNES